MLQGVAAGKAVRAFVVWEPVLASDWSAPSQGTMGRIPDVRALHFWDPHRVISHAMGEHDRKSIAWDQITIYGPGATWNGRPPEPLYEGRPVVKVVEAARAALARAVESEGKPD
jgi:hypothetical protein